MSNLRNLQPGDRVRRKDGKEFTIREIYNQDTAAQQVLLSDEYYPILVAEMEKLGYQYIYDADSTS